MERALKLYTYVDGVNDAPFPNSEDHILITAFTYDAKRMGDAPSISFTLKHTSCLDNVWDNNVYVVFNGEKYYLKQTPTSSYDNTDSRYKHEVIMVSERIALNETYFFDVVSSDTTNDKPVSNSSNVVFSGDIHEFAARLKRSLAYSKLGYDVIVDDGVTSETKLMSFDNQFFANVLQEAYDVYGIPYYFVGKEIHIGHEAHTIDEVFEYGAENSLLSIQKANANYKVVNRCTGTGSQDNIPYYYPNLTPYGDLRVLFNGVEDTRVRIFDWARFSRCGVSGILSYNEKTAASGDLTTPPKLYVTDSHYFRNAKTAYGNEWEAQSEPFNLEDAHNLLFINGAPDAEHIASWTWFVVDETGNARDMGSWSTGTNGIYLDNGTYYVKVRVMLKQTYSDSDTIDTIARNHTNISIYKQKKQEAYNAATYMWQLNNGSFVSLNNIGVVFTGTPQIGDVISFRVEGDRIRVMSTLMPSIYRKTKGAERFYEAINNKYINPDTGDYYSFNNPFIHGRPKEHIVEFDDIKPSITNVKNQSGQNIDTFLEFAYDLNDNDEIDSNNQYEHPFFYAKLRKFDGDLGFNIFTQASESGDMTISMTTGNCAACKWDIVVDESTRRNCVRVDESGNLLRDADGNVLYSGSVGRTQNDTTTEEVWIQLRKEDSTFGILMPNMRDRYRPSTSDKFVILNIALPQAYIEAAETRLDEEIIKYMSQNNDEKFTFSIKFSRIYLAQNERVMANLSENSSLKVKYNNETYTLHVSSYSYKVAEGVALPEIVVQLSDTLTIQRNALQNVVSEVKREVRAAVQSVDTEVVEEGQFVSRVHDEAIYAPKTFLARSTFGATVMSQDFSRGAIDGRGWSLFSEQVVDDTTTPTEDANTSANNGQNVRDISVLELDKLIVRSKLEVNELTINQAIFQKGRTILSAAACKTKTVEVIEKEDGSRFYRCYYNNEQDTKNSGFVVGDLAICIRFDMTSTNIVKQYWREVIGVGTAYVDLTLEGSSLYDGIPEAGDNIVQLGNRSDTDRQGAIVISSTPDPMILQYDGIYTYSLPEPTTKIAPGDNYLAGMLRILPGSTGLSEMDEYKELQAEVSSVAMSVEDTNERIDDFGTIVEDVKAQADKEYTIWFYDHIPTLSNMPAVEWINDEILALHDQDLFYSKPLGRAWRFVDGEWEEITDADTIAALGKAKSAESKAEDAMAAVSDLEYLKDALPQDSTLSTTITNAMVLSSLLGVWDSSDSVVAFLNGTDLGMHETYGKMLIASGIPSGSDPLSLRAKNAAIRLYEDGTLIANKGVFKGQVLLGDGKIQLNQDGSGQLANGAIKWDANGVITQVFPSTIQWIDFNDAINDDDELDLSLGGYFDWVYHWGTYYFTLPNAPIDGLSIKLRGPRIATRSTYPAMLECEEGTKFVVTATNDIGTTTTFLSSKIALQLYRSVNEYGEITLTYKDSEKQWLIQTDGEITQYDDEIHIFDISASQPTAGITQLRTTSATGTLQVTDYDETIVVTSSSSLTLTLPSRPVEGRRLEVVGRGAHGVTFSSSTKIYRMGNGNGSTTQTIAAGYFHSILIYDGEYWLLSVTENS